MDQMFKPGVRDPRQVKGAQVSAARRSGKKMKTVTEAMNERALEKADEVMRPFFEGLALEPKPEWSASTKLRFYSEQAALADRLLNRTEGVPSMKPRGGDTAGALLGEGEVSSATVVGLIAKLIFNDGDGEEEGDVIEGEVISISAGDASS